LLQYPELSACSSYQLDAAISSYQVGSTAISNIYQLARVAINLLQHTNLQLLLSACNTTTGAAASSYRQQKQVATASSSKHTNVVNSKQMQS